MIGGRPKHTGTRQSLAHYAGIVAKNTETQQTPEGIERVGRALGFAAISVVGLGVVCIVITLVGAISGASNSAKGIWPTINILPQIAFPIGVLLILAWLVINMVKLRRQNRGDTR